MATDLCPIYSVSSPSHKHPPQPARLIPALPTGSQLPPLPLVQSQTYRNTKTSSISTQPFFSAMGCTASIVLACFGASYGTAKSGIGIMSAGVLHPDMLFKSLTPIIFSGILAIYGLVISVLITQTLPSPSRPLTPLGLSFTNLGAGLCVGLSCLAAGFSIGIVGDAGVRATAQQPRLFVGMMLILIFGEVLGLYGLIVGLLMISQAGTGGGC